MAHAAQHSPFEREDVLQRQLEEPRIRSVGLEVAGGSDQAAVCVEVTLALTACAIDAQAPGISIATVDRAFHDRPGVKKVW